MKQKSLKTSKAFIVETGIFSCRLNAYKWNTLYKRCFTKPDDITNTS